MKKKNPNKTISREFLSEVVEISTRIASWYGFHITSWDSFANYEIVDNDKPHVNCYNSIGMTHEEYGDFLDIDFVEKTICLEQRYYDIPQYGHWFSRQKHLDRKDLAALLALSCEFGFELIHNERFSNDIEVDTDDECDCEETETETETETEKEKP